MAKQRLFIYDRKEVVVLGLLGIVGAAFAFTLGVHLGKRVNPLPGSNEARLIAPAGTTEDPIPNRQEFVEQAKGIPQAADEALNQSLHDEVVRTGVKLDTARQVELPEKPVSKEAGATTLSHQPASSHGKFTLQIGSHASLDEAKKQAEPLGAKAYIKSADLGAKGHWYRVYLGDYSSKDEAQKAGNQFKSQKLISSFVVSRPAL